MNASGRSSLELALAGEWARKSFAELVGGAKNIIGGPFGSNLTRADYVPEGIPVIRGSNMERMGRYIGGKYTFVSPDKADALATSQVAPGDIVVTQRGTLGQVSIVPSGQHERYVVSQSQMGVHVEGGDPLFVFYLLKSPIFLEYLDGTTIQTGVPHINMGILRSWEVTVPSKKDQQAIAAVLAALDDKIELNQRLTESLEAVVRSLFKSWFFDFDPVHAKAGGRPTDLPDNLDALFPNGFSEQGLPAGWRHQPLSEVVKVVKGASYKSDDLQSSTTALVTLKSFQRGGGYKIDGLKAFTGAYKQSQVIVPGELIVAATDVTQAAEVIGQPAIVPNTDSFQVLVASLDTFILRPNNKVLAPWFLERLLRARNFPVIAQQYATGTTVLHLSPKVFDDFDLPILPSALLQEATDFIGELIKREQRTYEQSNNLVDLRNTLLPKLLSGELRIADAEKRIAVA